MSLSDVASSLNRIIATARDYEEDMWHEENAILEGVFREIADELEYIVIELNNVENILKK